MSKTPHPHNPQAPQAKIGQVRDHLLNTHIHNFRLVEKIGKGGFGAVYKAEHTALGSFSAIKILWPHLQDDKELLERFFREAQAIARVNHPHVIRVTDFGFIETHGHYLIMDYLEGKTLSQAMRDKESFPLPRIQRIFRQLCSALQAIHAKGIVHRDLKPANIFLCTVEEEGEHTEEIRLLDFGIAALANQQSITLSGASLGSPRYMSPEQAAGRSSEVDARSDIYSMGILLFKLLTGKTPFSHEGLGGLIVQHLQTPAPPLREKRPEIQWAPALEALLQSALAKTPQERPHDAKSFYQGLEKALEDQQSAPAQRATPTVDELSSVMEFTPSFHSQLPTPATQDSQLSSFDDLATRVQPVMSASTAQEEMAVEPTRQAPNPYLVFDRTIGDYEQVEPSFHTPLPTPLPPKPLEPPKPPQPLQPPPEDPLDGATLMQPSYTPMRKFEAPPALDPLEQLEDFGASAAKQPSKGPLWLGVLCGLVVGAGVLLWLFSQRTPSTVATGSARPAAKRSPRSPAPRAARAGSPVIQKPMALQQPAASLRKKPRRSRPARRRRRLRRSATRRPIARRPATRRTPTRRPTARRQLFVIPKPPPRTRRPKPPPRNRKDPFDLDKPPI